MQLHNNKLGTRLMLGGISWAKKLEIARATMWRRLLVHTNAEMVPGEIARGLHKKVARYGHSTKAIHIRSIHQTDPQLKTQQSEEKGVMAYTVNKQKQWLQWKKERLQGAWEDSDHEMAAGHESIGGETDETTDDEYAQSAWAALSEMGPVPERQQFEEWSEQRRENSEWRRRTRRDKERMQI
jgi:hypothetical protein